jgi:hypothetical protein
MEIVQVAIEGTTPLLLNRFTDEAQLAAAQGTRSAVVGERGTPREQAELKLYRSAEGSLIIPQPNMFRCIIDAGTFFKAGKSKITTQKTSLIPACVAINAIEIPLLHREPWEVDTRAICIPSTGGRILCHRPKLNDWRLEFDVEIDTDLISVRLFREIMDTAGKRVGLGDYRPARKGPFGKFVVTNWCVCNPRAESDREVPVVAH